MLVSCYLFPAPAARCLVKWLPPCLGTGIWALRTTQKVQPFIPASEGLEPCSRLWKWIPLGLSFLVPGAHHEEARLGWSQGLYAA